MLHHVLVVAGHGARHVCRNEPHVLWHEADATLVFRARLRAVDNLGSIISTRESDSPEGRETWSLALGARLSCLVRLAVDVQRSFSYEVGSV